MEILVIFFSKIFLKRSLVHVVEETTTKEKLFPNGISLNIMLKHLNIQFTGREHCGMDDALNIAFILIKLLEENAELRVSI